jgi:hypothetical protein
VGAQHIWATKNITQEFIEYSVSVVAQILMHWHKAISRGGTIKITKNMLIRFMKFTTSMQLR